MPKSRDDFKAAFKTVKKPKPPTKDAKASKVAIDKAIDKDDPDGTLDALVKQLVDSGERDYIVKLVAYKYAKHYEDGSDKRPAWATKLPAGIVSDAMAIVVPDGFDKPLTKKALDRAIGGNPVEFRRTADMLYARDPDGMTGYALQQIEAAAKKGDLALVDKWVDAIPVGPANTAKLMLAAARKGDAATMAALAKNLPSVIVLPPQPDDQPPQDIKTILFNLRPNQRVPDMDLIAEIAEANPKLFAKEVLPRLKDNDAAMLPLISDEAMRGLLKREAGPEWAKLVEDTPILTVFDGLETKIEEEDLDTPDKVVGGLFDMVVNNEGIDLSYYTNTFYNPKDMMLGPVEGQQKYLDSLRKASGSMPDGPASQCSMLTNTIQRMLEFSPGMNPKPTIVQKETPKMAMTVPLASIKRGDAPIKGLLDKSFPGNVFDEAGAPTGRVMFTGSGGVKAHTWLIVNGVAYDSVLGTKGDEVEAAVGEEFRWIKPDVFAKGNKGSFLVQVTDAAPAALATKPKVTANKMGFNTAYVLTKTPDTFLSEKEKADFGLASAKQPDKKEDWENPRDDRRGT